MLNFRIVTMKRLLLMFIMSVFAICSYAGTKNYSGDNVIVHFHGNYFEIIDNKKNVCIVVKIEEEKKSTGEIVYNIFCENKYTKGIAKYALTRTIKTLVSSVATPVVGGVAGVIASDVYDDVCEYYK